MLAVVDVNELFCPHLCGQNLILRKDNKAISLLKNCTMVDGFKKYENIVLKFKTAVETSIRLLVVPARKLSITEFVNGDYKDNRTTRECFISSRSNLTLSFHHCTWVENFARVIFDKKQERLTWNTLRRQLLYINIKFFFPGKML